VAISARVIADSCYDSEHWGAPTPRITTFVLRYPRFIHSEFMTHRMFSRNASSSRAIPVQKMIDAAMDDPAVPIFWGKNQPGMQAAEELQGPELAKAKQYWLEARNLNVDIVRDLNKIGLHKQIANRLLEPWMHIEVICTATDWDNFYALRTDAAAQPEMRALAVAMLSAHNESIPRKLVDLEDAKVITDAWHLPFVTFEERQTLGLVESLKHSVARCARVSYLNHEGKVDPDKDAGLHDKLLESGHFSPFEHQARIFDDFDRPYCRNFHGFEPYRALLPGETKGFTGLK
jgi:thymidylate synthase ThyX